MATLYLIRHGQASFMHSNYDQLSALGEEQARVLGKYLGENKFQFDACFSGLLVRHQGTLANAREAYQSFGLQLPENQTLIGLNEHEGAEIHGEHLPNFLNEPENFELKQAIEKYGRTHPAVRQGLLRLFFKGTKMWALGQLHTEGRETFADFKTRVNEAYHRLRQAMAGKENVIAFTSGGTIGMLLGLVLGLNDEKVIELNWQIRNCSITELAYSKDKFYLRGFNYINHFQEERLITYV
jgi:broad specificity phosphatase PhoE